MLNKNTVAQQKSRTKTKPAPAAASKPQPATKPKPQPATTILLIRHAQTPTTGKVLPGRAKGLKLADKGIAQAQATAEAIAHRHKIAAIYSSPMERARQTAEPLAQLTKRQIRIHPGLNECDFGRWTGRNLATLRKTRDWQQVQRNPSSFRFPHGESFTQMQTRIVDALTEMAQRHRGKTIAAYSHADTIKAAMAHALGVHLDLFQRIAISPASVSVIQLHSEGSAILGAPVVLGLNQTF